MATTTNEKPAAEPSASTTNEEPPTKKICLQSPSFGPPKSDANLLNPKLQALDSLMPLDGYLEFIRLNDTVEQKHLLFQMQEFRDAILSMKTTYRIAKALIPLKNEISRHADKKLAYMLLRGLNQIAKLYRVETSVTLLENKTLEKLRRYIKRQSELYIPETKKVLELMSPIFFIGGRDKVLKNWQGWVGSMTRKQVHAFYNKHIPPYRGFPDDLDDYRRVVSRMIFEREDELDKQEQSSSASETESNYGYDFD